MFPITQKLFDIAMTIVMFVIIIDAVVWIAARSFKRIKDSIHHARS